MNWRRFCSRWCWGSLGRGLCFHQLTAERAVGRALMGIKDRQREGEREKDTRQPCRELHQNVRGLRAKNVFRDPAAKGRAEAFALRALHQNYQHHEQRHEHVNSQEQIDEQVHRDGEYDKQMTNVE